MKKILSVMLAVVLCAGCGKASDYVDEQVAKDNESSASAEAASHVTITNHIKDLVVLDEHRDMSDYVWDEVEADVKEISLQESIRFFTDGGSGILYYGREKCPWCQRAYPVLAEAANDLGVSIYYIDVAREYMDNDEKIPQASAAGQAVYDELCSYISSTFALDENGEPVFQVPLVIGVKNGAITGSHLSLVDDFSLSSEDAQLSDSQRKELRDIYEDLFRSTAD